MATNSSRSADRHLPQTYSNSGGKSAYGNYSLRRDEFSIAANEDYDAISLGHHGPVVRGQTVGIQGMPPPTTFRRTGLTRPDAFRFLPKCLSRSPFSRLIAKCRFLDPGPTPTQLVVGTVRDCPNQAIRIKGGKWNLAQKLYHRARIWRPNLQPIVEHMEVWRCFRSKA